MAKQGDPGAPNRLALVPGVSQGVILRHIAGAGVTESSAAAVGRFMPINRTHVFVVRRKAEAPAGSANPIGVLASAGPEHRHPAGQRDGIRKDGP